ncbi:beta-galactosidase BoGH2A [Abditibacteriota bacterium]|nr:beta-galactosidase BoGH2A [Abditibacteriota bacterium]
MKMSWKIQLVITLAICSACTRPALSQQTDTLFDADWRFRRGPVDNAEKADFNDSGWRRVQLPHDWSIEDLPPTGQQIILSNTDWRFHTGDEAGWKAPEFDDRGWSSFSAPATYNELPPFAPGSYGWYRKHIIVPPVAKGKDVELIVGKVDDVDETFVNGVKVGQSGSFPPTYNTAYGELRAYPVPAQLLKGDGSNVVAVRVYNGEGAGGLYAPVLTTTTRSGPFDSTAPGSSAQGFTTGGVGWYRKTFTLPPSQKGRNLRITFDGVYMDSTVWLNGQLLGKHPYGYTSFSYDLTPFARIGQPNTLVVRMDSSGLNSRWYSGSGIYRHVHLTSAPPVHFAPNGIIVTTQEANAQKATVRVRATIHSDATTAQVVTLTARLIGPGGQNLGSAKTTQTAAANADTELDQQLSVAAPQLWSPDKPTLYRVVTTLDAGRGGQSQIQTMVGIRTIALDATRGFLLNGEPLKLRGGCVHHDNGPLGSAAYDRAEERRVELLKSAGFNCIRTSHNPPSSAFVEACDRVGMLVMEEAFDAWTRPKNPQDYSRFFNDNWQSDIRSMVERDRNHPSVVMWSIGNEIPEQTSPESIVTAKLLSDYVRRIDPTRPTTLACNLGYSAGRDDYFAAVSVAGYNYKPGDYVADHERHPDWLMQGTESFPRSAFEAWMPVIDHPYVIGDFVWTALDYIGEAGIGRVTYPGEKGGFVGDFPWTVAGCGDIDLIGTRKPQSYYRGILWGIGPKVAAFVDAVAEGEPKYGISGWGWPDERASWTWPSSEGKNRIVRVFANTPRVKLLLNGRDLGTKETTRATSYIATYSVPYEPGELVAVGLNDAGTEVERWALKTASAPATLRLTPARRAISADGQDLSFVTVEVVDSSGNLCPNAANLLKFSLQGSGQIIAVGNGNPQNIESLQQPQHSAFQGRALVIVKGTGQAGELRLTATADDLKSGMTSIKTVLAAVGR